MTLKINAVESAEYGPSLFFNVSKAKLVNDEVAEEEVVEYGGDTFLKEESEVKPVEQKASGRRNWSEV